MKHQDPLSPVTSEGCRQEVSPRMSADPLARRDFLRLSALSAAGLAISRLPAIAGPFDPADFDKLVPADKKLSRDWIASLYARGEPTVYRGADLRFIGMPVGGLCAGQLYLGGDGRLWLWDIFNQPPTPDLGHYAGPHYAKPMEPSSPIEQGFALKVTAGGQSQVRTLDRQGFKDISFRGQYPLGTVEYRDTESPVAVTLEAFSPFIPLNVEDSELPATVMSFKVRNTSSKPVDVELAGWIENAACLGSGKAGRGSRRNRILHEKDLTLLHGTAEAAPEAPRSDKRPDIVFDDFEKGTYDGWTATGTAFGTEPMERSKMPAYQGVIGQQGERLVNTHNARQGEDVGQADAHTGTLTSRSFTIERDYITFLIGGGAHKGKTCVNLLVADQAVLSATGQDDNRMKPHSFDVRAWAGQTARLQAVDNETGGWGHIGLDDIVFSDTPRTPAVALEKEEDFGSLGLALLGPERGTTAAPSLATPATPDAVFAALSPKAEPVATKPFGEKLVGAVGRKWKLKPGAEVQATFVVTWFFPAVRRESLSHVTGIAGLSRSYAKRFDSAASVARYVAKDFDRLAGQTRLWRDTWYDSTLPHWFLDRTFLNNSIAATATCLHFDNGRFYGWEGTYCCAGTCQHVWQYAQGLARTFPQLERAAREITDYGIAYREDGALDYRAEAHRVVAIDGQAGTILRVYREHQMSADDAFLRRIWPRVKKSVEHLMARDGNDDGMLEGEQYNTLDASWYGQIAWLSSLYVAAVRAGAAMARDMGDADFARRCDAIADRGSQVITERLFNGDYYIQRLDPKHADAINTNEGCHIDQVYGQSWAFQVGLPRVLPAQPTKSALAALWKYNFTPDVGVYRKNFDVLKGGRWYAMPGEGGLLMCTWPKGGAEKAAGKGDATFVGYFNECMTGFEYQVAGHMIWEGLVEQGLAVTRMIHDRYHASKRNPWNEVECSSHYARAMASHGAYLAACGFEYDGPKGRLAFAPRLTPGHFRAAFTAAEGWGTFSQKVEGGRLTAEVSVKWGRLRLKELSLAAGDGRGARGVTVTAAGKSLPARGRSEDAWRTVALDREVVLKAGDILNVRLA
jgi:non-lysosomal glucosylceramidase